MSATEQSLVVEEAVTVVPAHDGSGEVVDLAAASLEELAEYVESGEEAANKKKAHVDAAKAQLRHRMDSQLDWTLRIGDPSSGVQWEAKCPSPDAGTETFHSDELVPVLEQMIEERIVARSGADQAIRRRLVVTLDVPLGFDIAAIATGLETGDLKVFELDNFDVVKADQSQDAHLPGIKKLRKVPAAAALLQPIAREVTPTRRVTVKRVTR